MRTFTLNNITYTALPFGFNTICDLEDLGVSLEDMNTKPLSMVRAYIGLCIGKDKVFTGKQIEEHMINGGTLQDVISVMSEEMNDSDFFRSLTQTAEAETTATPKKRASKKAVAEE